MSELYQTEEYILNQVPIKIFNHHFVGEEIYTAMHWHRSVEFNLVTSGQIYRIVSGKTIKNCAGEWCIVNSSEVHSDHWVDTNDVFEGITLQISKTFIEYWLGKSVRLQLPRSEEGNQKLVEQLLLFGKLCREKEDYGLEVMEQVFHFMILLKEYCIVTPSPKDLERHEKEISSIIEIINYIDEHYQEPLTLGSMAADIGYSSAHLSRMFKENIGQNFHDYLQNIRLAHSVSMLKDNRDLKLADCAMLSGFPNVKSFIQTFKKFFGCTPSEWLRK